MELKEKISPKHTALLVVDIQNDFAAPDGLLAKGGRDMLMVEPMIEKLRKTIDIAQITGVPIFYTQQIYDRSKLTELQKEQYDMDGRYITCDIKTDRKAFDAKLEFDITLIPYKGNDNWIEKTIIAAHKCLNGTKIPKADPDCDYCNYIKTINSK